MTEQRRGVFAGKTALITGGTRGIGLAIAEKFAREGADLALLYAGNKDAAQAAEEKIAALGGRCLTLACDVSDGAQVTAALEAARQALGAPDILVNSAGITRDNLALRMKEADFRRVVDVNLTGAFLTIRGLLPDFIRRRSGRILNIASVSALLGNAGQANYAAAKAGLIALTKSVAREVASRGITVNAIAPGFVKTDMTGAMGEAALEKGLQSVPMGRMAEPWEIAEAAAFLAGDGAAYITGCVLRVDGGLAM